MGAFVARQPNGLLCRFSTVVDTVTDYNMTEDDYVEMCAEQAREKARYDLKNDGASIKRFCMVIKNFVPYNDTREEFLSKLREMGDNETQIDDLLTIPEEEDF